MLAAPRWLRLGAPFAVYVAAVQTKKRAPRAKAADDGEVGARRRRELLDAAFEVIAEQGIEGLRTRDVAARAGVNIATLHYHFGTKEALVEALEGDLDRRFRMPTGTGGDPRAHSVTEELHEHLVGAWRAFHATPQLSTVIQELVIRSRRDSAARARFGMRHVRWNKIVEDLLRSSTTPDKLRPDLDPALTARVVTSFIMGAVMQLEINPRAFSFEAVASILERALTSPGGGARKR